jgi:hypothetical protein
VIFPPIGAGAGVAGGEGGLGGLGGLGDGDGDGTPPAADAPEPAVTGVLPYSVRQVLFAANGPDTTA